MRTSQEGIADCQLLIVDWKGAAVPKGSLAFFYGRIWPDLVGAAF
jgi:hypothetical protein